jgi:hypothetical protein
MTAIACRAALLAACFFLFAIPSNAEQPAPEADSYLPPARFIAKEPETRRSAAADPAPATTAAAPAAPAAKTIGLISVVGENFHVKTVGITVFGNEEQIFPVTGWKVDDKVAASTARLLKKNFKLKRIQIPAGAFKAFRDGDFLFKSFETELAKFIGQYTAGQKCDYYLLVSPGYSQIGNSNQGIYGLGVVRLDNLFSPGEYVHALSMLTVYDPQMKQLRSEFATMGQETFLVAVRGPHQEMKDPGKLPPQPKAAMEDPRAQKIAWELLDKSLAMTLPKLFAAN